jgi:methionine-rich copper-binding protein CopC
MTRVLAMTAFTRRGALALVLAIGLLICGSIASQGPLVAGHSQLVTSAPGAGGVLEEPPAELRLVFSEPLEDDFTGLVLADSMGVTIPVEARVDEADRRVLVAPLPSLPDGAYTVNWTALSAADGHVTAGFISFGIGDAMMPSPGGPTVPGMEGMEESGSVHAGHTGHRRGDREPLSWCQ